MLFLCFCVSSVGFGLVSVFGLLADLGRCLFWEGILFFVLPLVGSSGTVLGSSFSWAPNAVGLSSLWLVG